MLDNLLCRKLFVYLPGQKVRPCLLDELQRIQFDRDFENPIASCMLLGRFINVLFLGRIKFVIIFLIDRLGGKFRRGGKNELARRTSCYAIDCKVRFSCF